MDLLEGIPGHGSLVIVDAELVKEAVPGNRDGELVI
jgi:hypothetical protein